jgi:hypothetical protein
LNKICANEYSRSLQKTFACQAARVTKCFRQISGSSRASRAGGLKRRRNTAHTLNDCILIPLSAPDAASSTMRRKSMNELLTSPPASASLFAFYHQHKHTNGEIWVTKFLLHKLFKACAAPACCFPSWESSSSVDFAPLAQISSFFLHQTSGIWRKIQK